MIKDENLVKIKEVIKAIFPDSQVILFGSRSRDKFDSKSDYDILVTVKRNFNIKEKCQYASEVMKRLAILGIPADVIVKTEEDVIYYQDKIGSVVREALKEGVSL